MKKFAIVTCVTPNWLAPAAVTLLSCAQHGAEEFADLIIVSFDVSNEEADNLALFNKIHGTQIKLQKVKLAELEGMGIGRLGVGSLLRLKLDTYMSKSYSRILYLDSDVLAESNCKELFELDLNNKLFGAVESIAMLPWINKKSAAHLTAIGMAANASYFNAGVIIFDWKKTFEDGLLSRSFKLLKQNPTLPFQDQDALNISSAGNWQMLNHRWNVTKKTADYLNLKIAFRHFNGSTKPWNTKLRFGFAKYYNFYLESLKDTAWSGFMVQQKGSWSARELWRAVLRFSSFRRIQKLKQHIAKTTT